MESLLSCRGSVDVCLKILGAVSEPKLTTFSKRSTMARRAHRGAFEICQSYRHERDIRMSSSMPLLPQLTLQTIIGLHVLLLYTDSFPALPVLFSIGCHIIYLSNFTSSWPVISLSSPRFLASCLLVIADHFTWFFHFANKANEAKRRSPNRYSYNASQKSFRAEGEHGFMDVAAFFGICVWSAPLFLFLSLSANDNALPSSEFLLLSH